MAGIRLSRGASVIWFGAVGPFPAGSDAGAAAGTAKAPGGAPGSGVVVTVAGAAGALPGTAVGTVKVTPYAEYPPKGRATGGVRCQRFLRGEDTLVLAWAGAAPALGATEAGHAGRAAARPRPPGRIRHQARPAAGRDRRHRSVPWVSGRGGPRGRPGDCRLSAPPNVGCPSHRPRLREAGAAT